MDVFSLLSKLIQVRTRLTHVVHWYLISLMVPAPKHTQSFAAEVSGLNKSQFSRLLKDSTGVAEKNLTLLSKNFARDHVRQLLVPQAPWKVGVLIDATLHGRSSRHIENSQRFNHGQGWVIGHQWTNIVLLINERKIPLPPIPFLTKKLCRRLGKTYQTEHDRVIQYLSSLDLKQWLGAFDPSEIVVLMDSGYDNKKLHNFIVEQGWDFVSSLKNNRSSATLSGGRKSWRSIRELFRTGKKQSPWKTLRLRAEGAKKRRTFVARQLVGWIKDVFHPLQLVCSKKDCGQGRRYLACSNLEVPIKAIICAYRKRWNVELFHRATKQLLGHCDAGVERFISQVNHVHWVYCAYLILDRAIGQPELNLESKQKIVQNSLKARDLKNLIQMSTHIAGAKKIKTHCQAVLQDLRAA